MKVITLLLDGVGDRTYEILDHQTPLQYANTPYLDQLAKKAQCGLMTPLSIGVSLGTDLAHFILFNYSLQEYPTRTIIDAYGEKLTFNKEDLLLRASFAKVDKRADGYYIKERFIEKQKQEEIAKLIKIFNRKKNGYTFEVIHSYDSHCFLKISGSHLSASVSDSDPFYSDQYVMKVEPFESETMDSQQTADLINDYLKENYELLSQQKHECNFLLTKWAGKDKKVEPFQSKTGMSGLMLGKSKLLEGISTLIEMKYQGYDTFSEAIEKALVAKEDYVHLHTKKTDTASHSKNVLEKVRVIESIDQKLKPLLDFHGLLVITADHSTPCAGEMIHSGESVPFMATGGYIRRDSVEKFNEIDCSVGSIHLRGNEFIDYINNARDEGKLYHLRAGKKHSNFIKRDVNKLV
jgi:2,3-bisphosphoglycerate-independent phosphoglycerate mutase